MTYQSHVLKAKITFLAKIVWGIDFFHDNDVFDANPKAPIGIVSGFCTKVSISFHGNHPISNIPFDTVIPAFNEVLLYTTILSAWN
jgi:hypothetical protein